MQHDEVIWQLIMHGHCSFRAKTKTQNFCRNEYNVTGLCNRSSCPLANSRYATIREDGGRCYLYIKARELRGGERGELTGTIERAHTPKNMWQKIRLKRQYAQARGACEGARGRARPPGALAQVDEHLAHWPKFLVHKNKQRLTKITQYLIRMRKLQLKVKTKLVTMPARKEKQLRRKEAKAEAAAQLEASIEKELLARLQSGTYGDIYNFPMRQYEKVLGQEAEMEDAEMAREEEEEVEEYVEGDEEEEEEEEEGEEELEWVAEEDLGFDPEEESDMEDYYSEEEESGDEDAGGSSEGDEGAGAGPSGRGASSDEEGGGGGGAAGPGGKRKAVPPRPAAARGNAAAAAAAGGGKGAKRRRGRVEIEYEEEREDVRQRR
eukprot:scaffold10.g2458.t1